MEAILELLLYRPYKVVQVRPEQAAKGEISEEALIKSQLVYEVLDILLYILQDKSQQEGCGAVLSDMIAHYFENPDPNARDMFLLCMTTEFISSLFYLASENTAEQFLAITNQLVARSFD